CLQPQGDRRCHRRCTDDAQCDLRAGERCVRAAEAPAVDTALTEAGLCLPGACREDGDCPEDYRCTRDADTRVARCVAVAGPCARPCASSRDCVNADGALRAACVEGQCLMADCQLGPVCGSDGIDYASGCDVPWCRGVDAVAS